MSYLTKIMENFGQIQLFRSRLFFLGQALKGNMMAIERLVGLFVTDDKLYQKYREGMLPILQEYGGGFGYDFKVSEVLKSEVKEPINRVFTIFFKCEDSMNLFFNNEKYLEIKKKYYNPSVSDSTFISKYEK